MAIHSHIQLSHTILKHFRDESDKQKKVWYLDVSTKRISKKSSGRLGTQKGYYSQFGENYWNQVIENPLGKLNIKILSFCRGNIKTITINQKEKELVRQYIESAMVRSDSAFESMKSVIENSGDYTDQMLHDALSPIGMIVVKEISKALDFDNMVATVLVNRTGWSFVVPRNCFYCVERDSLPNYIAPISPIGALLLLPKTQLNQEVGNYCVIDSVEQIKRLNRHALKYESIINGEFVACDSRAELEDLQELLDNPPWKL